MSRLLVTIGSPLGLEEIKDALVEWDERNGLRVPDCVTRWVNVADRLDVVALDPELGNEYRANARGVEVEDVARLGVNLDSPLQPHSGTGYLRARPVRDPVRETVGPAFAQAVGQAVIARNLADDLEDAGAEQLHRTLIELSDRPGTEGVARPLDEVAAELEAWIKDMAGRRLEGVDPKPNIDRLRRFIAADLTRHEVECLRAEFTELHVERVWQNARKRALINELSATLQAWTAQQGYRATAAASAGRFWIPASPPATPTLGATRTSGCSGIARARGRRGSCIPATRSSISSTKTATAHMSPASSPGEWTISRPQPEASEEPISLVGMAPETALYGFRVLDEDGNGHDSSIIKALDLVASINEQATRLVIHGVNLSLGGAFDPSVYGCGHTPLCSELRRLWRQGVLVCLAAGNEGYAVLSSERRRPAHQHRPVDRRSGQSGGGDRGGLGSQAQPPHLRDLLLLLAWPDRRWTVQAGLCGAGRADPFGVLRFRSRRSGSRRSRPTMSR